MTDQTTNIVYPIAERFTSIDGEGAHAGRLAAFIRFPGCDLRCYYCDTVWAQDTNAATERVALADLVAWVVQQPCVCVTLTGGEPMLQPDLPALVSALCALDALEVVEIETNGSVDLTPLALARPEKLQFTMDYKLPSSGMEAQMRTENFALLAPQDVVKFVIGTQDDLDTTARVIRTFDLERCCRIYLSPVSGQMDPARIVDFMKERALTRATLQLQLHKIIWPAVERGV